MQNSLISDKFPEFGIVRITLMVVVALMAYGLLLLSYVVIDNADALQLQVSTCVSRHEY